MYLGHLKTINFPFVPKGKFKMENFIFGVPKFGHNYHFPFETNWKVVVLGVTIHVLKHFRVHY